jgi:hypothetical protein
MLAYLKSLENLGVEPNFWCSEEYLFRANAQEVNTGKYLYMTDEDWILFPMIDLEKMELNSVINSKIWSDFAGIDFKGISKHLDWEYLYDPKSFLVMEGGSWQVFRKNCRKFPNRFSKPLTYDWIINYELKFGTPDWKLNELFLDWLKGFGEQVEIHDDKVMTDYIQNGFFRKVLFDDEGNIFGLNIWDENYKYINFRFSTCKREPFLSEYIRLLFYTDPFIILKNKLVNDGGTLGNENLKRFKDKLNPVRVRVVSSFFKEN